MEPRGAVFQPELMLDEAMAAVPQAKRTSALKAEIASLILARAAKGERNPETLKTAALAGLIECSHYSHEISPERRAV